MRKTEDNIIRVDNLAFSALDMPMLLGNEFQGKELSTKIPGVRVLAHTEVCPCGTKHVRILVTKAPHAAFLADIIISEKPVRLAESFLGNNEDGKLNVHIYNEHRLVFRRGEYGMKLFCYLAEVDGKNVEPELSHGALDAETPDFCWVELQEGKRHLQLYTLASAMEKDIPQWHIITTEDNFTRIEEPDKSKYFDLKVDYATLRLRTDDGMTDKIDIGGIAK